MGRNVLNFPEVTGYLFEFLEYPELKHTFYHVSKKYFSHALVSKATRVVDLHEGVFVKDKIRNSRVGEFVSGVKDYTPFHIAHLSFLDLTKTLLRIEDVFFDLDGVIFDYDTQILNTCGRPLSELTKEEKYKVSSVPRFFSTMPVYEGIDDLFELVKKAGVNVHVLSAIGEREPARIVREKTEALHDKLSHWQFRSIVFVKHSEDKAFYASPTRLLIDDREKAYQPFRHAGGHIIPHVDVKTTRDQLLQLW